MLRTRAHPDSRAKDEHPRPGETSAHIDGRAPGHLQNATFGEESGIQQGNPRAEAAGTPAIARMQAGPASLR
ncbi:hypothetical protein DMP08_01910 [Paraeggerthella hongkongensis]|uniref:Uncharacterized protein n=1 Tax=Paraeggerthella hongkongensis TaxID=230658 RepID=A0A3N0BJD6_9ACTN|nr:hypothetical protein DMP08_01910 [Paraeggerthella hongkongensis]